MDDWKIQNVDAIFLGAGFSCAATRNQAPLMANFFDAFEDREYWTLAAFLRECFGSPQRANVEEAMLRLDQLVTSPFSIGIDPFIGQCRKKHIDLREELDRYTLSRLQRITIFDNWASQIVYSAGEATTVITTNYDNIAESIMSRRPALRHRTSPTNCPHCKMCTILEEGCSCDPGLTQSPATIQGALLKLHGSVAWRTCTNDKCSSMKCLVPDRHCAVFKDEPCPCCGSPCRPVLVMPSMAKTFEKFPQLHRMWDAAFRELSRAQRLLIFGFSFPISDALITEMFRCTIGRSKNIKAIGVIDTNPKLPIERIRNVLPNASSIHFEALPVDVNGATPKWVQNLGLKSVTQPKPPQRNFPHHSNQRTEMAGP